MVTIHLQEKEYFLPESWLDVNINTLQKLTDIEKENIQDEFEKEIRILHLLTKIPIDLIYDLPYPEFQKLRNALEFINMEFDEKMYPCFEYDGVKYNINLDFENMKTKEFIDLDELHKGGHNNLHLMMAVMYKQEGKENEYDVKELKKKSELFKENMSAHYALTAMSFTYVLTQIFVQQNSTVYSKLAPMIKKEQKKMLKTLKMKSLNNNLNFQDIVKNGDGM